MKSFKFKSLLLLFICLIFINTNVSAEQINNVHQNKYSDNKIFRKGIILSIEEREVIKEEDKVVWLCDTEEEKSKRKIVRVSGDNLKEYVLILNKEQAPHFTKDSLNKRIFFIGKEFSLSEYSNGDSAVELGEFIISDLNKCEDLEEVYLEGKIIYPITEKTFVTLGFKDKNNKIYNIQLTGKLIGSNVYGFKAIFKPLIDPLGKYTNIKGYKMKNSDTVFVTEYSMDHNWNNESKTWTKISENQMPLNDYYNYYDIKLIKRLEKTEELEIYEAENLDAFSNFPAVCKVVFNKNILPSYDYPNESLEGKSIFIGCDYLNNQDVYDENDRQNILNAIDLTEIKVWYGKHHYDKYDCFGKIINIKSEDNEKVVYQFKPFTGTITEVIINKNLLGKDQPNELINKNVYVCGNLNDVDMLFKELVVKEYILTK